MNKIFTGLANYKFFDDVKPSILLSFVFVHLYFMPLLGAGNLGIGGYYETEISARRDASEFEWNLSGVKHYFQGKFWGNPVAGVDFYSQISARTNDFWNKKQFFEFERGWGKWWFGWGEILALGKEERHWIDSPLLKILDQYKASYFNNAAALRLNVFPTGKSPIKASVIFTRRLPDTSKQEWYGYYYDEKNSENFISRLGAEFKGNNFVDSIYLGGTYLRNTMAQDKYTSENTYLTSVKITNDVYSFDFRSRLFPESVNATASAEYSVSSKNTVFRDGESVSPSGNNIAKAFEVRDINLAPFRFQGKIYQYGDGYRSELSRIFGRLTRDGNDSDKEFSRDGYYFESSYLWPRRMITFTYKKGGYSSRFDYLTNNQSIREDYIVYYTTESYYVSYDAVESRVDFSNGIKNTILVDVSRNRSGEWPGFLFELSGDTKDVYSRLQYRIKDVGSEVGLGERHALGIEMRYNLSERLQLYGRAVSVSAVKRQRNWASAFYQLRYYVGWDIEGYIEYGDGWHTDSLAYDSDITDYETRNLSDAIKVVFKVNF